MNKGFLKVGVPVLCAVPVAAGLATMGFSAATSLTGVMTTTVNFNGDTWLTDTEFEAQGLSLDIDDGWYLDVEQTKAVDAYVELNGATEWIVKDDIDIDNCGLWDVQTNGEVILYLVTTHKLEEKASATAGDTVGIYFDVVLTNEVEKGKYVHKTYPHQLFRLIQG